MGFQTRKAAVIGAGRIGSHCALALAARGVCEELVLIDSNLPKASAQAADLADTAAYLRHRVHIRAGGYSECAGADLVIVCAGNRPDAVQVRSDARRSAFNTARQVAASLKQAGFCGILVNVMEPCDVTTHYFQQALGLPAKTVIGIGTLPDTARLLRLLSEELDVDPKSIHGYVMGEHGESQMVPWSQVRVGGKPLFELMAERSATVGRLDLAGLSDRTRRAGWGILDGKDAAEFGTAAALSDLVCAIFHEDRRILPVSAQLDGEYGQTAVYAGVPAVIGRGGVEEIVEIPMTDGEQAEFSASCEALRTFYHEAAGDLPEF